MESKAKNLLTLFEHHISLWGLGENSLDDGIMNKR